MKNSFRFLRIFFKIILYKCKYRRFVENASRERKQEIRNKKYFKK